MWPYLVFKGLISAPPDIYLRFKGLIQAATNIYLRFRGLVAKYKHHANRMVSMSKCPIYSVHSVLATP